MATIVLSLLLTAGEPAGDSSIAWLEAFALAAELHLDGAPERTTDLDGDGRADTVVLLERVSSDTAPKEHHALLVGTRGWRLWLTWGSGESSLVSRGREWVFCLSGSGSGQRCSTLEFSTGRPRVLRTSSGNANWSDRCDYARGVCTRCEPCEEQDGQQAASTHRRVRRWSGVLPDDLAWTPVASRGELLRWLSEQR
ncbi:MAG: hypothetical protein ACOZQL_34665 [Myxococcota bacterium]